MVSTSANVSLISLRKRSRGTDDCTALKSEALAWRMTGDQSDSDSTYDRIDMLWKYHGRPQGIFSTDEHLGGLNPSRGWVYARFLVHPKY